MKKILSIVVSLLILGVLYWKIDVQKLVAVFHHCNLFWLSISILMNLPLIVFSAWRLKLLVPDSGAMGLGESTRLILISSVLNVVLPSKMGDIAKAFFMTEKGRLSKSLAFALVIFEKSCDMLSLLLWCTGALLFFSGKSGYLWVFTFVIALSLVLGSLVLYSRRCAAFVFSTLAAIAPGKVRSKIALLQESWRELQTYCRENTYRFNAIVLGSVFIWFLHLLQIWFFILTVNAWTPFWTNLALSPLAILAGLLPLTFAGVGTRDAAIIVLYKAYLPAAAAAALGLLCTSRYLIPALVGLPFLNRHLGTYFGKLRGMAPSADVQER